MSLPFMMLALGGCNPASAPVTPPAANVVCDDTATSQFVASKLSLPSLTRSYAVDLDGDGSTDNHFQTLFTGLQAVGFKPQTLVNNMVTNGRGLVQVELRGDVRTSGCSTTVRMQSAYMPTTPPKYDGRDAFAVRSDATALSLSGRVSDGKLGTTSAMELQDTEAQPLRIYVTLVEGVTIPLDLYGVQIEGTMTESGALEGELHAVLRAEDIQEQVIPAMAQALTAKVNTEPESTVAQAIIPFFEDMDSPTSQAKCEASPEQCCATNPATCVISAEELRENTLLMEYLAPDVQMFQDGVWSPTPEGTEKDSLSIGFGISAVPASFESAPEALADR
jgi:hypothetical protein